MLFELNEKTNDDMKHLIIKIEGNPIYNFYYQKGDQFNVCSSLTSTKWFEISGLVEDCEGESLRSTVEQIPCLQTHR